MRVNLLGQKIAYQNLKHRDPVFCFEQILEATLYKIAALRPFTSCQQTLQVRLARCTGYCWRSKDGLNSNILQWISTYGHGSVGWPVKKYIHLLYVNTGCHLEELPRAKIDKGEGCESVKDIHAVSRCKSKLSGSLLEKSWGSKLGKVEFHSPDFISTKTFARNIIIIIISCHQRRYPWPSLATPPYRPLLPAGLQG